MDRRRERQQHRYLPRDTPEAAGFEIEGNLFDGRRLVYNTETGHKFRATLQRYPSGHWVECEALRKKEFFLTGTRWQVMADYCETAAAMREAA